MKPFIKFDDIDGQTHLVNPDYIVQLHTQKRVEYDRNERVREYTGFYVNVASAGVACYNAEDVQVDEHTYFRLCEIVG